MTKLTPRNDPRALAVRVVERLKQAGHEAYWAGGCVRDYLLGLHPTDYDVATSARTEEVRRLFPRTIAIGESFGVVKVIGGSNLTVEVATFRSDGTYSDGRRPDFVQFSSPQEDALRRDFTINGMFFNPLTEEVLDFVGGQHDLEAGIIRAIGNPHQRFDEDKLRLIRAVRFAARFGFSLEEKTFSALAERASSITLVSAERILAEMRRILEHPSRVRGTELLWASGLGDVLYPEIASALSQTGVGLTPTLAVLGHPVGKVSFAWAMAALATTLPGPDAHRVVKVILERQKASNEEIDGATWLVQHRDLWRGWAKKPTHVIKRALAHPGASELIELAEALEAAETHATDESSALQQQASAWGPAEIDPPPLLTGEDLMTWGYVPGRSFKEILTAVRNGQLDGVLASKKEAEAFVRSTFPLAGSA